MKLNSIPRKWKSPCFEGTPNWLVKTGVCWNSHQFNEVANIFSMFFSCILQCMQEKCCLEFSPACPVRIPQGVKLYKARDYPKAFGRSRPRLFKTFICLSLKWEFLFTPQDATLHWFVRRSVPRRNFYCAGLSYDYTRWVSRGKYQWHCT